MPDAKKQQKEPFEFRLQRYYTSIDVSGFFAAIGLAIFIYFFPWMTTWLDDRGLVIGCLLGVSLVNGVNFLLYQRYHRKIFFDVNRYVYVLLFLPFIIGSGGIRSPLIFLLIFPVIVSAVDLDPRTTRRMGIIVWVILALLILLHPADLRDPSAIGLYLFEIAIFSMLPSYMYIIVRETLRQKYERDEASRRFTRLVEVEELKNDFLSVAQHQLRTPLSGIRFALETLRSEPGMPADDQGLVDSGIERVGDAIKIVNDMLTTAESGLKDLVLRKEPVDLPKLVGSILKELDYVARQKEVAVHAHMSPALAIAADEKRLRPALANIIDNALKYSPHGKVEVTLSEVPAAKSGQKAALLTVKDTGIGISSEDKDFVFNRFFRGKNAVSLEPDQTGVGLYTAKHIIERHGGTISFDSEIGKGTTVSVTLPLDAVAR